MLLNKTNVINQVIAEIKHACSHSINVG